MPGTCCSVRGCHNSSWKKKLSLFEQCFKHGKRRSECCGPAFNLYAPPAKEEERHLWLQALNLKHPPKRAYVCSFHFVDNKPTTLHPYPEKWLGQTDLVKRSFYRKPLKQKDATFIRADSKEDDTATQDNDEAASGPHYDHDYAGTGAGPSLDQPLRRHRATQCSGLLELHRELLRTDRLSLLYTGFRLREFTLLSDQLLDDYYNVFTLDARDQVLMTLMALRLNLLRDDLAERFHVSPSVVGNVLSVWLDIMEDKMRCFTPWIPRDRIFATMPPFFKENYPTATCVIDCFETNLQKPHKLKSRGEAYCNHYNQNTVKYLLAMAPSGLIMFVSVSYTGRCSGKFMASDSGFLDLLKPGDAVVVDRGRDFPISDLLHERQVQLLIPAEEDTTDTTDSRGIADPRFPAERVFRRLKKFKILSQTVPTQLAPKCDQILRICAALCNLQGDVVHEDR